MRARDIEKGSDVEVRIGEICRDNAVERGRSWNKQDEQKIRDMVTDETGANTKGVRVLLLRTEEGGEVGGVVIYKPEEYKREKVMHIHEMQLETRARGQGKGREALECCIMEGREMGKVGVVLQVSYENIQAREAYEAWEMEEGISSIMEQEDGECYQIRQVIWEERARDRLEGKRRQEEKRRNM